MSGLTFYAYNSNPGFNNYNSATNFSIFGTTPNKTGIISTILNTNDTNALFSTYGFTSNQYIAAKFTGYFTPNVSGNWGFLLGNISSGLPNDDLSYLWIGNNALSPTQSNFTGMCYYYSSFSSCYVYSQLTAGTSYPILLYWGQSYGGFGISLGIIPPGGSVTYNGTPYYRYQAVAIPPLPQLQSKNFAYETFKNLIEEENNNKLFKINFLMIIILIIIIIIIFVYYSSSKKNIKYIKNK
jgi:hypothetical protein